jgi:hypothetical protein
MNLFIGLLRYRIFQERHHLGSAPIAYWEDSDFV